VVGLTSVSRKVTEGVLFEQILWHVREKKFGGRQHRFTEDTMHLTQPDCLL